jgi:hypothetical protein
VYALGLGPAEVQERLMERAAAVPEGSVARVYIEGVDPAAYRLLDLHAVRDAAGAALLLKLEPQFVSTTLHAELPTVTTLGAQWDRYVEGQDLTGMDRERVRDLGRDYLDQAILGAPAGAG